MKPHLKLLFTATSIVALLSACDRAPDLQHQQTEQLSSVVAQTPKSIATEHAELHETLAHVAAEGGEMAAAAGKLEGALAPHFKREEQIATPPLGLLPALARGDATAEMRSVLPMTHALERELPQMLREHEAIPNTEAVRITYVLPIISRLMLGRKRSFSIQPPFSSAAMWSEPRRSDSSEPNHR